MEWTLRQELLDIQVLQIYRRNPLNYAFNPDLSALLLRTEMKVVMARFAGQNVDGKLVSGKVRARLQSGS